MTKQKNTKKALLTSVLSLMLCIAMLIGTTFAWFTDSVASGNNKIQAGILKVDLELLDKNGSWNSIKDSQKAIFDYDNWEPGYTDVKILKVENEGSLALKWAAKFVSEYALTDLANVIDVYVCPSETELTYPTERDLDGYTCVGTVAEFVNTISETTNGTLEAEECAYLGIALKMQESAGNEYQGMSLGGDFDIMILATQYTSENDSFDNQYDKDASYTAEIDSLQTLLANAQSGDIVEFTLSHDAYTDTRITVPQGVTLKLDGNGHTIISDMDPEGEKSTALFYAKNADIHIENATITGSATYAIFTNAESWYGFSTDASLTNVTVNMNSSTPWYPITFNGKGNIALNNCTVTGAGSSKNDSRIDTHVWAGAEINLTVNGGNVGNVLMNANSGNNSTLTLNDGAVVNKLILATDQTKTAKLTNNDGTINELIQQADDETKLRTILTSAKSGESVSVSLYKKEGDITITENSIVVPNGVNLTIYGDGHTINTSGMTETKLFVTYGGNIEINDLTITGDTQCAFANQGGNVTMNNVEVDLDGNYVLNLNGGGKVVMNDCVVNGEADFVSVWFGDGRTVTINGGTYTSMCINASKGAGVVSAGTLTVNNATIDTVYVGKYENTKANLINNNSTIGQVIVEGE